MTGHYLCNKIFQYFIGSLDLSVDAQKRNIGYLLENGCKHLMNYYLTIFSGTHGETYVTMTKKQ
jgi:hypothetical protein